MCSKGTPDLGFEERRVIVKQVKKSKAYILVKDSSLEIAIFVTLERSIYLKRLCFLQGYSMFSNCFPLFQEFLIIWKTLDKSHGPFFRKLLMTTGFPRFLSPLTGYHYHQKFFTFPELNDRPDAFYMCTLSHLIVNDIPVKEPPSPSLISQDTKD